MANQFATTKNIAREILPILKDNLVMPNLCYKNFESTFAKQGDTIMVRKPAIFEAKEFTKGGTVTEQDFVQETVDVKMDKVATIDLSINSIDMALSLEDLRKQVLEPAAAALAEKINADGLKVYTEIPTWLGTAGTTPDGLDDFAAVRKALNKAKAPMAGRKAVWDVEADAMFTQIGSLVKVNEAGADKALREGEIGRVYGLDNYMSQGVAEHVIKGSGTVAVDGAATAGATTIHLDGITTALAVGDTFTIAGDTTIYTVMEAGKLETADQDVVITPALAKNAADDAVVTMGSNYTANLAFCEKAIAYVTRPLPAPKGVEAYTTSNDGISLRVVRGYDMSTKNEKMSVDVLYGYKVVYPELALVYRG